MVCLLERMSILCLLYGLFDVHVNPEGDSAQQDGEGSVGKDRDEGEQSQGEEQDEGGGEHNTTLFHISPID